jgi:hypothetical protein
MRDVLQLVVSIVIALSIAGAALVAGDDGALFVPAPETVAEEFMRGVVAGRARQAMSHADSSSSLSVTSMQMYGDRLRATGGPISQVEGEPGTISGDIATAFATITTERRGEVRVGLSFVRRQGLWRITGLSER